MRQPIEWDADRWPNFSPEEGANPDWSKSGLAYVEPKLLDLLQDLRTTLGFPLRITSAYRSPLHNVSVSSTGFEGPHTTGLAVDVGVAGKEAGEFLEVVMREFTAVGLPDDLRIQGIGIAQRGLWRDRFIHIDALSRPHLTIWSY